jgi:hypothetical protein
MPKSDRAPCLKTKQTRRSWRWYIREMWLEWMVSAWERLRGINALHQKTHQLRDCPQSGRPYWKEATAFSAVTSHRRRSANVDWFANNPTQSEKAEEQPPSDNWKPQGVDKTRWRTRKIGNIRWATGGTSGIYKEDSLDDQYQSVRHNSKRFLKNKSWSHVEWEKHTTRTPQSSNWLVIGNDNQEWIRRVATNEQTSKCPQRSWGIPDINKDCNERIDRQDRPSQWQIDTLIATEHLAKAWARPRADFHGISKREFNPNKKELQMEFWGSAP